MYRAKRTFSTVVALLLGTGSCLLPSNALAQPAKPIEAEYQALQVDVNNLKTDVETIKRDLAEIRKLLAQRPAEAIQPRVQTQTKVGIAGSPMLGKTDAPVTLVEFSDYQCSYCGKFFTTVFPALKSEYIDTGKLRYVFRDFPLEQMHGHARKAHEAAHCAGAQGKYWEMHDLLFQNQRGLEVGILKQQARKLGLTSDTFEQCLDSGKYAGEVDRNIKEGSAANISGTPTFFVGKSDSGDTILGTSTIGVQPLAAFRAAIDGLLKAKEVVGQ